MKSKKGGPCASKRSKKYVKPKLVKHGLMEAEAAAFSTLY